MGDTHKIQFYRVALRRGLGIRKLYQFVEGREFEDTMRQNDAVLLCRGGLFTIYAIKKEDGYNLYIMKRYHYYRRKK